MKKYQKLQLQSRQMIRMTMFIIEMFIFYFPTNSWDTLAKS